MNAVHPTFAPFLVSIAPAVQKRHHTTGTQFFSYTLAGVDLACEIEWDAAERGTRDEPSYPASAVLYRAETKGGDDITELLSIDQQGEIEEAFLNQDREY